MGDCPIGILVEVCSSPSPKPKVNDEYSDFLKTLKVKYATSVGTPLRTVPLRATEIPLHLSPPTPEDDLITSEIFDFAVPALEEIDEPVYRRKEEGTVLPTSPFQFPILSSESTNGCLDWNNDYGNEALKISKRLSLLPSASAKCISTESESSVGATGSESSVGVDNRTYTVLRSVTSSDGDDAVFLSPCSRKKQNSENKENNPKLDNDGSVFVPHPNAAEALTPKDVKKIRGPLLRRGTYTLDNDTSTPKKTQKLPMSGSRYSQGSAVLRATQNILQDAKVTSLTPKMVPRSKSFIRTPQASPRISTFRTESPQVHNRRSISLDRSQITHNYSGKLVNQRLAASKVSGPSPLLRAALGPKPALRPNSATTTASKPSTRGPMKATPLGISSQSHQPSKSVLPTYSSAKSSVAGPSRSAHGQVRSLQQSKYLGSRK